MVQLAGPAQTARAAAGARPPPPQRRCVSSAAAPRRQQQQQLSSSSTHRSWHQQQHRRAVVPRAAGQPPPPVDPRQQQQVPPPPPPPPPPPFGGGGEPIDGRYSATPRFQDLSWREVKERYLRPGGAYLKLSFGLGAATLGLRVAAANYSAFTSPFEFAATMASTGLMCMALAWVVFDFEDTPPPGGNFSSPRK